MLQLIPTGRGDPAMTLGIIMGFGSLKPGTPGRRNNGGSKSESSICHSFQPGGHCSVIRDKIQLGISKVVSQVHPAAEIMVGVNRNLVASF